MSKATVTLLLPLLGACDASFEGQRTDLDGSRIAGLGVRDGIASVALWSGEGFAHSEAAALSWTLDGEALGTGYEVAVPDEGGLLELEATTADGTRLQGEVSVRSVEGELLVQRATHAAEVGVDLDSRSSAELEEVLAIPSGQPAVLSVSDAAGEPVEPSLSRWMVAGGAGTALGLDASSATFYAEELVFDDGELEEREALGDGWYGVVGLFLDGEGGNRWAWIEVPVGVEHDGGWLRHEGRLLPWEGDSGQSGLVRGTVVATGDVRGVSLDELAFVEDLEDQEVLACAPVDQPFRLSWVAEGRCGLDEVVGATVVVETW